MGLAAYSSGGTARSTSAAPAAGFGFVAPLVPRRSPRHWHWGERPVAVLKIAPFWRSARRSNAATAVQLDDSLGLDAFGSEAAPIETKSPRIPAPQGTSSRPSSPRPGADKKTLASKKTLVIAASTVVLIALAAG